MANTRRDSDVYSERMTELTEERDRELNILWEGYSATLRTAGEAWREGTQKIWDSFAERADRAQKEYFAKFDEAHGITL